MPRLGGGPTVQPLLIAISALLVLGMAAQWIAWRLGLPSILLLLVFGYFSGEQWLDLGIDRLLRPELLSVVVSASVAVILFEGGLSLRLGELRQHGRVTLRLVTVGALVTWALSTLAAHFLAGFRWDAALLLGAIVIVSGPTVVLPLLRLINPQGRVGSILKWEGIGIDPVGALLAVLVFEGLGEGVGAATGHGALGILKTVVFGGLGGLAGGWALVQMLRRYWIPDHLHNPVSLTLIVGVFALSNAIQHESGLLAVTIMGMVAGNQASVSVRHILEFKENLRVLLISGLFLLLASQLTTDDLASLDAGAFVFLGALILVVRPLAVLAATWGSRLDTKERIFLAWLCPRGIVAAAVASVFAQGLIGTGHPDGARLVPITFLVIVGTVVVYGLTARPLARKLGLALADPQGVLFIGAHEWAREIASALQKEGVPVLLVDANRRNVTKARLAELPAYHGDALDEEVDELTAFSQLGRVLALTPNDEVNTLVAMHYVHAFGRSEVYQLVKDTVPAKGTASETAAPARDFRGRRLFAEDADYYDLAARVARGRITVATLSDQFDFARFLETHGERALPLFAIAPNGSVSVATPSMPLEPGPGTKLVAIVEAAPEEEPAS
jgi:NhaP-type Na+/H+ or K+/H+ antiporter